MNDEATKRPFQSRLRHAATKGIPDLRFKKPGFQGLEVPGNPPQADSPSGRGTRAFGDIVVSLPLHALIVRSPLYRAKRECTCTLTNHKRPGDRVAQAPPSASACGGSFRLRLG